MLVKAKWNVKDASGWHNAGDVFQTDSDLGNAVEVLDAPKPAKKAEIEKEPVKAEEPVKEAPEKPKAAGTRRRPSK